MKILHQNNNNHIIVEYCVKQNCIYSVHSTWLHYSTPLHSYFLSLFSSCLHFYHSIADPFRPDPLDEEHIYDTIYNFYIINWGDCMKGVIDMDEINFCVITKGVGWLAERWQNKTQAASNTVTNKISKEKHGEWGDILVSEESLSEDVLCFESNSCNWTNSLWCFP